MSGKDKVSTEMSFCVKIFLFSLLFSPLFSDVVSADFEINVSTGTGINSNSKLIVDSSIRYEGRAKWSTYPFREEAPWYSISLWFGKIGIQLTHHKLYLESSHIKLHASHGFNLFTFLSRFDLRFFEGFAGGGMIISHTESVIGGKKLHEEKGGPSGTGNYYLSGFTAGAGLMRKFRIAGNDKKPIFYLVLSGAVFMSYAELPVAGGVAKIPLIAHIFLKAGISAKL